MRESCCCPPETNNTLYNIVSHLQANAKHRLQKENADCSPRTLVAWLLPYPWSLGRPGAHELIVLGLRGLDIGPPEAKLRLIHPKDVVAAGPEELWKTPWARSLLVTGFPPPPSFLGVAPPVMTAPPTEWSPQDLGCPGHRTEEGRRVSRT